jgi:hypothetical protein
MGHESKNKARVVSPRCRTARRSWVAGGTLGWQGTEELGIGIGKELGLALGLQLTLRQLLEGHMCPQQGPGSRRRSLSCTQEGCTGLRTVLGAQEVLWASTAGGSSHPSPSSTPHPTSSAGTLPLW